MLADMVARITVLERTCAEKDAFLKDTMAEVAVLRSKVDCLVSQNVRAAVIMVCANLCICLCYSLTFDTSE